MRFTVSGSRRLVATMASVVALAGCVKTVPAPAQADGLVITGRVAGAAPPTTVALAPSASTADIVGKDPVDVVARVPVAADGRFVFEHVSAGIYTLWVGVPRDAKRVATVWLEDGDAPVVVDIAADGARFAEAERGQLQELVHAAETYSGDFSAYITAHGGRVALSELKPFCDALNAKLRPFANDPAAPTRLRRAAAVLLMTSAGIACDDLSVPASDLAWALGPPVGPGGHIRTHFKDAAKTARLVEDLARDNPDERVRAFAMMAQVDRASRENRADEAERIATELTKRHGALEVVGWFTGRRATAANHRELPLGKPFPTAPLKTLSGADAALANGPVLVVVSGVGCTACDELVPSLAKLAKAHPELRVVTLHAGSTAAGVEEILAKQPAPGEHVAVPDDRDPLLKSWFVDAFPTLFLVDAAGTLRATGAALREPRLADTVEGVLSAR